MKDEDLSKIVYALEIAAEPDPHARAAMRKRGGLSAIPREILEKKWKRLIAEPAHRLRAEEIFAEYSARFAAQEKMAAEMPGLGKQALSLGKAAAAEALAIMEGKAPVSSQAYAARVSICTKCPERVGDVSPRCRLCGCFIKAKARMRSQNCPLQKWAE